MIVKKILSCAAVMSALLFSDVCAAQDALSLVPADAGVVMRIEAGRILEKMGGEEFISKVVVSDDDTAEMESFSLEGSGIALDRPVYLSMRRDESLVAVMSVSDADDFARTAQMICEGKLQSRKGVSWIVDNELCIVFDSDRAVVVSADKRADAGYWRSALMSDDGRVKGLPANGLRRLEESDADMFVMASGSVVEEDELARMKDLYGNDMPVEDLTFVWSLDGDDSVVRMHYGVVAESDAAAKYLDRNTMGMKRVEGRYADCIPASSMFVIYSSIDGDRVTDMLSRLQIFADENESESEDWASLKRIVGSLSGDMAVVMGTPVVDGGSVTIPATVMARVKSREIMDFVVRKLGDDTDVEKSDDGYVIDAGGDNIIMSCRNGDMVITSFEGMTSLPRAAEPTALKGSREGYGGFYLDVKGVLASAGPFIGLLGGGDSAVSLLSRIECVEGYAERPDSFLCTVRLSDERDNIYRILADAIVAFEVEDDGEAVTEE